MTHVVLWALFLTSISLLILLLLRNRYSVQWLVYVGLNVVMAAVLLYGMNWLGISRGFHLPINIPTITTISILGVPGLMLLVALKVTVMGMG